LEENLKNKMTRTMTLMDSWIIWKLKEELKVLKHLSHQSQLYSRKELKLQTLDKLGHSLQNSMIYLTNLLIMLLKFLKEMISKVWQKKEKHYLDLVAMRLQLKSHQQIRELKELNLQLHLNLIKT